MKKVFFNPGDRSFIVTVLEKKSKIVISLKVQKRISNQDLLVSFASITKLKNNTKNEVVIVDYFTVTEVSPRSIVPHFN